MMDIILDIYDVNLWHVLQLQIETSRVPVQAWIFFQAFLANA